MLKDFYKKNVEKIHRIVMLCAICIAVVTIFRTDYHLIKSVCETGRQCYAVNARNVAGVPAENNIYRTAFTATGSEMLSVEPFVSVGENPAGSLIWWIEDVEGQPATEQQTQDIAGLVTEDKARLALELPEGSLQKGTDYVLVTEFVNCSDVTLQVDSSNQLAVVQYFAFTHQAGFITIIVLISLFGIGIMVWLYWKGMGTGVYAALFIGVGMMAVFLIPPMSRDDELRHFLRVYTLARGETTIELAPVDEAVTGVLSPYNGVGDHIITVPKEVGELRLLDFYVNYMDNSYQSELNQMLCLDRLQVLWQQEDSGEEVRISCVATATRGMTNYWPQVVLVWLGMKLGLRPLILYYLARIGQMLACAIMGIFSLKLAGRFRDMVWLLTFIPNVVILKSCCNSDGLLIAEMMLLATIVIWLREKKYDIFSWKALGADIVFCLLTWQITKMKIPYLLFCGACLLLLRKENFRRLLEFFKKYRKIVLPAGGIAVLAGAAWLILGGGSQWVLSKLYGFVPEGHVAYIVENPKYIAKLFGGKCIQQLIELYQSMKGGAGISYAAVVIVALLLGERKLGYGRRLFCAVAFGALVFAMVLLGYTLCPPDYGIIWGISFRYLLPVLPIGMLVLPSGNEGTERVARSFYPAMIVMTTVTTATGWLVWLNRM